MHGLDQSTDLSFFQGQELIQLALGCLEFQLRFSSDTYISIQSDFSLSEPAKATITYECKPAFVAKLYILLGSKIAGWSIDTDGGLTLNYDNGYKLTIHDTNALLESYVIWHGDDFYAV